MGNSGGASKRQAGDGAGRRASLMDMSAACRSKPVCPTVLAQPERPAAMNSDRAARAAIRSESEGRAFIGVAF